MKAKIEFTNEELTKRLPDIKKLDVNSIVKKLVDLDVPNPYIIAVHDMQFMYATAQERDEEFTKLSKAMPHLYYIFFNGYNRQYRASEGELQLEKDRASEMGYGACRAMLMCECDGLNQFRIGLKVCYPGNDTNFADEVYLVCPKCTEKQNEPKSSIEQWI